MDTSKIDRNCGNCRFREVGLCAHCNDNEGYTEIHPLGHCRNWQGDPTAKGRIEKTALQILKNFPQIKEQPASISGNFHVGETIEQHLERCASVMRHLCDGMGIHGEDRDMLIACAYLHDIGIYSITQKGEITAPGWKYHKTTGWSRIDELMKIHPTLSAVVLDGYHIPRQEEIKRIISTHMGYWYQNEINPRPKSLYEYLMVEADYLATRPQNLIDFTGENIK
jgi:putative nucleotidyltransferase with HDIG domain